MDMHSDRRTIQTKLKRYATALVVVMVGAAVPAGTAMGDNTVVSGGTSDIKRTAYPIAIQENPSGDPAAAKEVLNVASFDLSVAGPFKVLDPKSFLARPNEGLDFELQKWKDVGAFGVVKYRVTATEIEFRLYEVSKGDKPTLTKSYSRKESPRAITHKWCNAVFKHFTGENGFFGSRIVFTAKATGASKILAMDFDGANTAAISNNSSINILPAFSPSGGIAYTSFMRGNPDLYVTGGGGGRPTALAKYRGMNTGASYSPDGSKIALTLSKDGNPEIYIINAKDGAIVRRVTDHRAIETSPAWSPDGSQIAFVSDRNGGPQIFVVSANGGSATQVSFNGSYNTTPAWSPKKGKQIIAYTTRDGANYDIVTLDLQTKEMKRITQQMGNNEEPSFSPNGRAIAFARAGQGIFIANADGTGTPVKVWSGSATGVDWGPAPPQ